MTCWTAFHEGGDASKKLKDGRTVTKTNNAQWPKSVTIAKMMMRFQCQGDDHGEYLEDQQYDFCKAVTIDNGNNYGRQIPDRLSRTILVTSKKAAYMITEFWKSRKIL